MSDRSSLAQYGGQFEALMHKNKAVLWRRTKSTLFILLAPVIFLAVLVLLEDTLGETQTDTSHNWTESPPNLNFKKATSLKCAVINTVREVDPNSGCISLGYAPNSPDVTEIVKSIASDNQLDFEKDVMMFPDAEGMGKFVSENPAKLSLGLTFFPRGNESADSSSHAPLTSKYAWEIWFNGSTQGRFGKLGLDSLFTTYELNGVVNMLEFAVQKAVLELASGGQVDVEPEIQAFPQVTDNPTGSTTVPSKMIEAYGGVFFLCGTMVTFIIVINLLIAEKEGGMLGMMRVMNMHESAYLLSWFLALSVIVLLETLAIIAMGHLLDINFFTRTDFSVLFVTFFTFLETLIPFGFFFSAFCKTARSGNVVGFLMFAVALSLQIYANTATVLLPGNATGTDSFFDPVNGSPFFLNVLFFFPPFNFAKTVEDINTLTQNALTIDPVTGQVVIAAGGHYTWDKMFDTKNVTSCCSYLATNTNGAYNYEVPGPYESLWNLVMNMGVYAILAWYLAQVISTGDGSPLPWYFPFSPEYYGFKKKQPVMTGDRYREEQEKSRTDNSVRLHKLSKTFENTTALKELTLTMQSGRVFCLLGHNGAGKSTAINILTGLFPQTHGSAFIQGYSVDTDMKEIRAMMGICPQHEVLLWEDLTAREHLSLYARFKGVPKSKMDLEIAKALQSVNLTSVIDDPSGTYSGGMKRRLSVAIAGIGNPRIVFLDEPTAGLDPLSRRRLWGYIQELKKDRILCLTTHYMEEADILGDDIAIMSAGHLRAYGTSTYLKNRYGAGYQANLLCDGDKEQHLERLIKKHLPDSEILDQSAGNFTVSISKANTTQIPAFFKLIETDSSIVKEWGIQMTSLEEVFLRLNAASHEVNAVDVDFSEQDRTPICVVCNMRPSETVTLFTENGLAVETSSVICSRCAFPNRAIEGQEEEEEQEEEISLTADTAVVEIDHDQEIVDEGDDEVETVDVTASLLKNQQTLAEEGYGGLDNKKATAFQNVRKEAFDRENVFWPQVRAQFIKNLQLKKREKKWFLVCQILFPILAIIIAISLQSAFQKQANFSGTSCNYGLQYSVQCSPKAFQEILLKQMQPRWSNSTMQTYNPITRQWETHNIPNFGQYMTAPQVGNKYMLSEWWIADESEGQSFKANTQEWFPFYYEPTIPQKAPSSPTIEFVSSAKNIYDRMLDAQKHYPDTFPNKSAAYYANLAAFPNAALVVSEFDVAQRKLAFKMQTYFDRSGYPKTQYKYKNSNTKIYPFYYLQSPTATVGIQSAAMITFGRAMTGKNITFASSVKPFPDLGTMYSDNMDQVMLIINSILFPLALMLLFPGFVSLLVEEKEQQLVQLMKMMGLKMATYWLSNYLYFVTLQMVCTAILLGLGGAVGVSSIAGSTGGMVFAVTLAWCHAQAGFVFLIASIFTKKQPATIFTYTLTILTVACGAVINNLVPQVTAWIALFPSLGFMRALYLAMSGKSGTDAGELIGIMFLVGTIYIVLGIFLFEFLPDQFGNRRKLSLPAWMPFCGDDEPMNYDSKLQTLSQSAGDIQIDEDVINEEQSVLGNMDVKMPIHVVGLNKTYAGRKGKPAHVAVKEMYLGVDSGQCFGLLGPNGAGKTTLISMLTGLIPSSNGEAFIGGYSVKTQMDQVHKVLGVCPQHNTLWDKLSTREHLLFYARLKGVLPAFEDSIAQSIAIATELDGDAFNQTSEQLSGGTQRRLCLGIALVGDPQILFMDEPSTGCDSMNRKICWRIINEAKKGRSLMLTTHSMEEADALCNRIGIVSHGELKCIGAPIHLKKKFGQGFKINVTSRPTAQALQASEDFVKSIVPTAELDAVLGPWDRSYAVATKDMEVSSVFAAMESEKSTTCIKEWQLSQSSLTEVFVNIIMQSEHEEVE